MSRVNLSNRKNKRFNESTMESFVKKSCNDFGFKYLGRIGKEDGFAIKVPEGTDNAEIADFRIDVGAMCWGFHKEIPNQVGIFFAYHFEESKKHFEEDLRDSDILYVEALTRDAVKAFQQNEMPEISINVFECSVEDLREIVDQFELDPEDDVYIGTRFFKGRILGRLFDVYAALYDAC
jgi:hypothetical protein